MPRRCVQGVVLTGYNTDIDFRGMTYHVQTEDKGRSNPVIESLVYANGEILYSRRTQYRELVDEGIDVKAVASLMDRQHRTIVEAIRRGMLEELSSHPEVADEGDDTAVSSASPLVPSQGEDRTLDQVILEYLEAQKEQAHLVLRSAENEDFIYGAEVTVRVVALNSRSDEPEGGVRISVVFKSTAEPRRLLLAEGVTDDEGAFEAVAQLPDFNGGTSAVVVAAEGRLGQAEMKHLVHR